MKADADDMLESRREAPCSYYDMNDTTRIYNEQVERMGKRDKHGLTA